jgi:transcriptional regulator with XRE-family HTH domain
MELYCCGGCGEDLIHLGDGPPPERCEDCVPETGPGSPLLDRLTVNLRRLRADAEIDREELATRARMTAAEISQSEGDTAGEPSVTKALRISHSLDTSIDDLVERIYWNPGEIAPRPSERRPASERLAGFFQVLPSNVPVFAPAVPRVVTDRHEAAVIFGRSVRDARERRHLNQTTLAQAAGLSKAGLSQIERGLSETTVERLLALARGLEVPPENLLGGIAWEPRRSVRNRPRREAVRRHAAGSLDGTVRRLWCQDKTAREIGAAVGASSGSVAAIVRRLREHGEDIPYRSSPRRAVHRAARERRRSDCQQPTEDQLDPAADAMGSEELSDAGVAERIGANVALVRREAGLTQEQLGEAIESDRTYVHRIEAGANVPRLALIVKLAASLNVRCGRITSGVLWRPDCRRFYLDHRSTEPRTGMARLGQNVRHARQRIDSSQQALGVRAEISRGDVVDFELGKRNFRIFTAVKIAGALGVDLAVLFAETSGSYVRPLPAPECAPGGRPPTKADRDSLLVRLWREGKPEREIAEALDLAGSAVGAYVRELRDSGVDLPYRRPPRTPAETAARRCRRTPEAVTAR